MTMNEWLKRIEKARRSSFGVICQLKDIRVVKERTCASTWIGDDNAGRERESERTNELSEYRAHSRVQSARVYIRTQPEEEYEESFNILTVSVTCSAITSVLLSVYESPSDTLATVNTQEERMQVTEWFCSSFATRVHRYTVNRDPYPPSAVTLIKCSCNCSIITAQ